MTSLCISCVSMGGEKRCLHNAYRVDCSRVLDLQWKVLPTEESMLILQGVLVSDSTYLIYQVLGHYFYVKFTCLL